MKDWTYGAEHEWADWPLDRVLPRGFEYNRADYSIVNSTGVANDPTRRAYRFGGELNTPPTDLSGQLAVMEALKKHYPEAVVNYRSNLHIHIRVPGLRDSLKLLKRLAQYNADNLPRILPIIEPIKLVAVGCLSDEALEGLARRQKRCRVSHHTVLVPARLERQLAARTTTEFFEAEVPRTAVLGKPMWHAQPRAAVNVRQLLQTDTIEFRHFPGTMDFAELNTALTWCREYLYAALIDGTDAGELYNDHFAGFRFPTFAPYYHYLENRYRATVHDGTLKLAEIRQNIGQIETGQFDEFSNYPSRLPL